MATDLGVNDLGPEEIADLRARAGSTRLATLLDAYEDRFAHADAMVELRERVGDLAEELRTAVAELRTAVADRLAGAPLASKLNRIAADLDDALAKVPDDG